MENPDFAEVVQKMTQSVPAAHESTQDVTQDIIQEPPEEHPEEQFGEKRCQRFMDKMDEGARYLADDLATWDDYIKDIKEKLEFEVTIRWNN